MIHHACPNRDKFNNLQNPAVPFIMPVDFCFLLTSISQVVNVGLCKTSCPIIRFARYLTIISIHCNPQANIIWNTFDSQSRCNAAQTQAGLFSVASTQCVYKFCITGPFMHFPFCPFKWFAFIAHSPHARLNDVCPVLYILPVVLQKLSHLKFNYC